jgi:hypothetical protein
MHEMINVRYETKYDGATAPRVCKIMSIDSDPNAEEVVTNLTLSNLDEMQNISDEQLWEHMGNMVEYIKLKSLDLTLVDPSTYPDEGWPAVGWALISSLNEELTQWWVYMSRRDSNSNLQVIHYH